MQLTFNTPTPTFLYRFALPDKNQVRPGSAVRVEFPLILPCFVRVAAPKGDRESSWEGSGLSPGPAPLPQVLGLPVASCLVTRAPIGSVKEDGSRAFVIRPYTPINAESKGTLDLAIKVGALRCARPAWLCCYVRCVPVTLQGGEEGRWRLAGCMGRVPRARLLWVGPRGQRQRDAAGLPWKGAQSSLWPTRCVRPLGLGLAGLSAGQDVAAH